MAGRLVWSTADGGAVDACRSCGKVPCACPPPPPPDSGQGARVRLKLEQRKGKPVTLLSDLPRHHPAWYLELLRELKKRLSCGGTWKDGVLELQGDQRQKLAPLLAERGWEVR